MSFSVLDLSTLNGSNGFVINGINLYSFSGTSVSRAGDVNGDGLNDVIIGAIGGDPNGPDSGQSFVVFGSSSGFGSTLELSSLNGSNGFALNGINAGDFSGSSVSSAGNVNGDGLDDLIIGGFGADINGINSGQSYVVFGSSSGFSSSLNLSSLNGSNGFILNSINAGDFSGSSVSSAGDVNGDGLNDLIIGAERADPNGPDSGQSYVVFGSSTGFNSSLSLSNLNGSNGFRLNGINASDNSGISVSRAGDVNGDGLDDLMIGASGADPNGVYSGQSYVVFGSSSGFSSSLNLSSLNGSNGFRLNGINAYDFSGASVSTAGDVNGDGLDDLIIGAEVLGAEIIGAPLADPNGANSGQSYVVFGSSSGFSSSLNLSSLNGSNGFVINGINAYDFSGASVSTAGDVNGDGLDDLLIGATGADPNGLSSGQSYVVFGSSSGFSNNLELSSLNGSNGFALNGINAGDSSGSSVCSAGDVNGDGIDDLIIGAPGADPNNQSTGQSYVVFGAIDGLALNRPSINASGVTRGGINANLSAGTVIVPNPNFKVLVPGYVDVIATSFNDTLVGNTANNSLSGGFGNDALSGAGGNDTLNGGSGIDQLIESGDLNFTLTNISLTTSSTDTLLNIEEARLSGGTGNNLINALSFTVGSVTLSGGGGNDTLFGGSGADSLTGGSGNDSFTGGSGLDTLVETGNVNFTVTNSSLIGNGTDTLATIEQVNLTAGSGDNALNAAAFTMGSVTLSGGAGHDSLSGGSGNDRLDGGLGVDWVFASGNTHFSLTNSSLLGNGTDTLVGIEQASITGGGGNNILNAFGFTGGSVILNGGAGNDTLGGGSGNDTLSGGLGNDSMDGGFGGSGLDWVIESGNVNFTLTNVSLTGNGIDELVNIDRVKLTGGSGSNTLNASAFTLGAVTLNGGDGNDTLIGGSGADSLTGGSGNDSYGVNSQGDVVTESANQGIDTVSARGTYTLGNHLEHLTLTGSAVINGTGNALNNIILGNSGVNVLKGGGGDDSLNGGGANDSMEGGLGNDSFVVGSVGDVVKENAGQGTDLVSASISYTLSSNVENLVLLGTAEMNGTGNSLNNSISGNTNNNSLNGGSGADTLNGLGGNDTLTGGSGNDSLNGGLGIDRVIESGNFNFVLTNTSLTGNGSDSLTSIEVATLTGANGNNTLNASAFTLGNVILDGGSGHDILVGGSGRDSITGGSGNDILNGRLGNDSLTGGVGIDTFTFNSGVGFSPSFGIDSLTDFGHGSDKIVLDKTTFAALTSVAGSGFSVGSEFAVVASDSAAATSSAKIVYSSSTGNLFYNQNGSTAGFGAGAQFADLTGNPTLSTSDFVIQA